MVSSIAIGLGCRKGASGEAIAALVRAAMALLPGEPKEVRLYSSRRKSQEPGLQEAAASLGYSLTFLPEAELAAANRRAVTRSAKVREIAGVDSVAETAALVGGGPNARLIVQRLTGGGAACAIAADVNDRQGQQ